MKTLDSSAWRWNYHYPIGTHVIRFKLVDPLREGEPTKTISQAWVMGVHSVMVKVEGVAGGVLLESVVPIPTATPAEQPAAVPAA